MLFYFTITGFQFIIATMTKDRFIDMVMHRRRAEDLSEDVRILMREDLEESYENIGTRIDNDIGIQAEFLRINGILPESFYSGEQIDLDDDEEDGISEPSKPIPPTVFIIGFGLVFCFIGYLLLTKQEPAPNQPVVSNPPAVTSSFGPKITTPKGEMLGSQSSGLYYKNTTNSYESGVAYKATDSTKVYIYDGKTLRPVSDPASYFRFYGCTGSASVIECAPVYEMPTEKKPIGQSLN